MKTKRHFPHDPPIKVCMKYLNQQQNTENSDTFVPITQIEHTLNYASFAIIKENITYRIEAPFVLLPYPIILHPIPDVITILMLILVFPVHF